MTALFFNVKLKLKFQKHMDWSIPGVQEAYIHTSRKSTLIVKTKH